MAYRRDDEALRAALEDHTVDGYEVVVPVMSEAVILDQGGTGPVRRITESSIDLGSPMVYYQVKAKHPVPFKSWAESRLGWEAFNKLNREEWIVRAGKRLEHQYKGVYLPMADYLRDKIEAGGSVSPADVEHDDLVHRGCIDTDDRVSCYTFWSNQVLIDPRQLRRGMLVEYEEGGDKEGQVHQGAIVGFSQDKKVAYLELFTPIPYLELPQAISNTEIKKSFYPDMTYAIGYGTYEAFEIAAEESGQKMLIPEGKMRMRGRDNFIYMLKEFMPLSVISELCSAAYGDEPHCFWQSLIMYVIPVVLDGVEIEGRITKGTWRPLPEKLVQVDAVISYEDEDEG